MIWHLKALWVLSLLLGTCSTSFPEASGVYNGWTSRRDWFSAIVFHSSGYEEEEPILNKPLQSKVPIGPSSTSNRRTPGCLLVTIPSNLTVLTFPLRHFYLLAVPTNSPIIRCSIKQVIAGGRPLKIQQPAVQMLDSLTLQFTMRAPWIIDTYSLKQIIFKLKTELTETSAIVISGTLLTITLLFSEVG